MTRRVATASRPVIYTPRDPFVAFHNRRQRWATLVTHRRAGKTVALVNDVIMNATDPRMTRDDPQYAYVGPTYKQAKRVAWNYLKRYSRSLWAAPPSESELKVTLRTHDPANHATIWCLGADNADALRGMYLDGFVADEYSLWKPSVFSQILRPAVSDRMGWGVFSGTPRGKNILWDQLRRAQKDPLRHFLLTLRADASGIIPPSELADLQADMDAEEFAQEYLCSFDSALKGAIYASEVNQAFLEGRLYPIPLYDPHLPTHFVYDLGFTDATVCIAYQLPPLTGRVRIVGVRSTKGVVIDDHIDWHLSFGGNLGEIWLPHDARAKNLQTGKSIVEQFLSSSLTPRVVPDHTIKDGIAACRKLWPVVDFDAHPLDEMDPFGDTPTSDLIEAAKQYHREWDEDNLCFTEQPHHDWSSDFMDCMRYLAIVVSPLLASSRSADNALESSRFTQSRIWTPQLGYNLETLHADAAITRRTMQ